ncbi:MAG: helix-turn-helix domain-containing protein [Bacteroidaceae bacterium]|nr:helix-turn-helix domain-containing protein [Bacteroidaceae bacterium]
MKRLPLPLHFLLPILLFFLALPAPAQGDGQGALPVRKIAAERLPDLNVARKGHAAACLGGELVVFGGHTTGFVPTKTAEWFDGKRWHVVEMSYTHDHAVALPLSSGKMLLAGGHEQPLGIGQTFTLETYDPQTHSFSDFGCLDRGRVFASAVELDSGRVLIAGNWYNADGLELWDGGRNNRRAGDVSFARSIPYVLRTARDNAIVFSDMDEHGDDQARPYVVDRLRGGAYEEDFLRTWRPPREQSDYRSDVGFVGDTARGRYAYILPVLDDSLRMALALVDGGRFSLLKTDFPLPQTHEGRKIYFYTRFLADRRAGCGYLVGSDETGRAYLLRADYADALADTAKPLRLALYVTDPLPVPLFTSLPVLTAEGDVVLTGGISEADNFAPLAAVYRLNVASPPAPLQGERGVVSDLLGGQAAVLGIIVLLAALAVLIYIIRYRRKRKCDVGEGETTDDIQAGEADASLVARAREHIEAGQLFLSRHLRLSDVAGVLGVPPRDLTAALRRQGYSSFPYFLNTLRVDYACRLFRERPEMKIRVLYLAAGFSSESTFFNAFSARTGQTPLQWLAGQKLSE